MQTRDLSASLPGYELLDSGAGAKLERIAGWLVERPTPQALWARRLDAGRWAAARSVCRRTRDGGGTWEHPHGDPGERSLDWQGPYGPQLRFLLRFTAFGHCGLFPEQAPVWAWLQERVAERAAALGRAPKVTNTFAYTGCGSLAMAAAGAEVFHVDSAKGVLDWCKRNLKAGPQLPGSLRTVHDDVRAFLAFSEKRGFTYDGIVLDPPSWGHGKDKKDVWTLEENLAQLLAQAVERLEPGGFIHCSCHTPGVQEPALVGCLHGLADWAELGHGEFTIAHAGNDDPRRLPAGIYAFGIKAG